MAQQTRSIDDLLGSYSSITDGTPFSLTLSEANGEYSIDICRNLEDNDCRSFYVMEELDGDKIYVIKDENSTDINKAFWLKVEGQGATARIAAHYADGMSAVMER